MLLTITAELIVVKQVVVTHSTTNAVFDHEFISIQNDCYVLCVLQSLNVGVGSSAETPVSHLYLYNIILC